VDDAMLIHPTLADDQILMLLAHAKNQQEDLTEAQKQILVNLMKVELENG
jgi:hypothetical protein